MQSNPPDNSGYMIAAYIIVSVLVVGYALSLVRRVKKAIDD